MEFASKNHQSRVMSSVKEKQKVSRILNSLKKEQNSLVESVKQTEDEMRQTLYELETLNPEKRSRFRSSRTIELK